MLLPDCEEGQGSKLIFIRGKVSAVTSVKLCLLYQMCIFKDTGYC